MIELSQTDWFYISRYGVLLVAFCYYIAFMFKPVVKLLKLNNVKIPHIKTSFFGEFSPAAIDMLKKAQVKSGPNKVTFESKVDEILRGKK